MRRFLIAAAAPLVLLSACAGTGGAGSPSTQAYGMSPYGMFLAGQAALNDGRSDDAARFFAQANAHPDGDVLVAERAFTAALLAGEVEKAVQLAPQGPEVSEATNRMAKRSN